MPRVFDVEDDDAPDDPAEQGKEGDRDMPSDPDDDEDPPTQEPDGAAARQSDR